MMHPLRELLDEMMSQLQAADQRAQELIRRNVKLMALARGCPGHRSYRAIMKPRVECNDCVKMYQYRKELNL